MSPKKNLKINREAAAVASSPFCGLGGCELHHRYINYNLPSGEEVARSEPQPRESRQTRRNTKITTATVVQNERTFIRWPKYNITDETRRCCNNNNDMIVLCGNLYARQWSRFGVQTGFLCVYLKSDFWILLKKQALRFSPYFKLMMASF